MVHLLKYIRYYILTGSIILSVVLYLTITSSVGSVNSSLGIIGRTYALIAVGFLYIVLLCTPLYTVFPKLPHKAVYTKAKRALGVSAFLFASLHGYIEFFEMLGGLEGFSFLRGKYLFAVIVGLITITILFVMTATSTNYAIRKLGKAWTRIHRLVYFAGILVVIHALAIGSHFMDLTEVIPSIFFALVLFLLILQSIRVAGNISTKYPKLSKNALAIIFSLVSLGIIGYIFFTNLNIGVHASHV